MVDPLWSPGPERIRNANLTRFIEMVNTRYELRLQEYTELYQWSIVNREDFWSTLWDFTGVVSDRKPDHPVVRNGEAMPGAVWFPDTRLNFAENLLRYRDNHPALIANDETGRVREITYAELFSEV
ncbi:acetoacetate--CoA ligase, partial [bacterium]|nr:acetoacetate--CoA ligase [bacterium]